MPSHPRSLAKRSDLALTRQHVIALLRGGHAHVTFQDAVARLGSAKRGKRPRNAEHSVWELVEHIRVTQRDILDFSRNTNGSYRPLQWPDDYWPSTPAPLNDRAWTNAIKAIHADRLAMEGLVRHPRSDLFAHFPWGDGQTLLREALMLVDHTSYHIGQIIMVRRLLGVWKKS